MRAPYSPLYCALRFPDRSSMATANLNDCPTPPPLHPPPRFMDQSVNSQGPDWSWPASRRKSQTPSGANDITGGVECESAFIAQKSASVLENSCLRPSIHTRNSVSGSVARSDSSASLNHSVHKLRSRLSISLTRPPVMHKPSSAEGASLL